MEDWNDGTMGKYNDGIMAQKGIRKKPLIFLPNIPVFQPSIIPRYLWAGEGSDDRTFTAFRTPNGNTFSWGQSYQGGKKIPTLSTYFHSYFSGYATLIDEGEFQGSFRGDRKRHGLVKREAHVLVLEETIGAEAEERP